MSKTEIPQNEIEKQKEIMRRVSERFISWVSPPLAYIDTYGCQQNESDSEILRGMLSDMGYALTSDEFSADVVIINTCAIRENAENRVLGNVGALVHTKKAKKSQLIVFCGCMAGVEENREKIRNSYKHVHLIFTPQSLWRFPELLERALTERGLICADDEPGAIAEGFAAKRAGNIKAWLPIMYGCDNYCSYCIVPYVRGRERSRKSSDVLNEARELVSGGYKDITMLGQNVNSYGRGLDENVDFPTLIRKINEIDGEFLLRFMTSHPKDAGEELFKAMAECEKAARHIHLPFQAGNDRILKLMNRGYTQSEFLKKLEVARKYMPDIVITSDVIVGFPGETDAEFKDTLKLVKEAQFDAMFTFIYSKRPGTKAEKFEDNVTREEKQIRFDSLLNLQNEISDKKHTGYIGQTLRVLVDETSEDAEYNLKARTNGGRLVHLSGDAKLLGSFTDAEITRSNSWSLFAKTAVTKRATTCTNYLKLDMQKKSL